MSEQGDQPDVSASCALTLARVTKNGKHMDMSPMVNKLEKNKVV